MNRLLRLSRYAVAVFMACALTAGPLSAQSACQSAQLDQIIKRYNDRCKAYEGCFAWHMAKLGASTAAQSLVFPPAAYTAITREMASWWNVMVGNTWARLGPRYADFGVSVDGNVVTPTKRTWYSLMPSTEDTRYVRVYHREGRSRTLVRVCVVDPVNARPSLVSTIEIPRNASPNKYYPTNAPNKELRVNNAAGKFVVVEIDPTTLGRSLAYSLRIR